jgi:hypothetical protein
VADAALARTPEIISFLSKQFGPYPFDAVDGVALDSPRMKSALRRRPGRCARPWF